ncbi:GNAT family N-acetyltransferase [Couchioplanes azureus]|uniref:GNAT family N-acetyltransferase n=1 Tax=Couchioplanes caeruleus TaxID=56438 RepID=UPI001E50D99A
MIETRVLSQDDWRIWRELRLVALAEAGYAFGSQLADWQGDGDREERWRGRLAIPGSHNVVAAIDGQVVGMASGVPTGQDRVVELISMYVAPQGRGRGVGDHLVRMVEQWARRAGAETLRLAVVEGNEQAQALYRRCGFGDTGELGDLMPDGVRRERIMAKNLGEREGTAVEKHDGLERFVSAQEPIYDRALAELRAGTKRSHWMWFVFPQIAGLGFSPAARTYAIRDLAEAGAYLAHPVLGPRLTECAQALLTVEGRTAREILGHPDDLKLRSSMTLFARAADDAAVFQAVLDKYYGGEPDPATLERIPAAGSA